MQEFIVEKIETSPIGSKKWRVRCTGESGFFRAHILGYYHTKKKAMEVAEAYNNFPRP